MFKAGVLYPQHVSGLCVYGIAQLEVIKERRKKAGERVHNKEIQNHEC